MPGLIAGQKSIPCQAADFRTAKDQHEAFSTARTGAAIKKAARNRKRPMMDFIRQLASKLGDNALDFDLEDLGQSSVDAIAAQLISLRNRLDQHRRQQATNNNQNQRENGYDGSEFVSMNCRSNPAFRREELNRPFYALHHLEINKFKDPLTYKKDLE